jgi:hypothetical protein
LVQQKGFFIDLNELSLFNMSTRSSFLGTEVSNNTEGTHLIAARQEMKK